MILGIWILKGGIPVISRIYEEMKLDETLVGGMLDALSSFASEVASEEIREVVMKNRKFAFFRKDVLVVIWSDLETPTPVLNVLLRRIYKRYSEKKGEITERDLDEIIEQPIVKIVFVGEANVGKTTLRQLILGEQIPKVYEPTIGAPKVEIIDVKGLKLSIWDFPGQEKYREGWPVFLRSSEIVFVVTDSTLENVLRTKKMLDEIKEHISAKVIYVIANKQDLPQALSPATIEEIMGLKALPTVAINPDYRPIVLKYIENAIYDALGFERPKENIEDIDLRLSRLEEKYEKLEIRIQKLEQAINKFIAGTINKKESVGAIRREIPLPKTTSASVDKKENKGFRRFLKIGKK
ncbi:MAG: ADP-ribosylation factor-like protein [Candidatus Asgardarchaeia archaeon]